MRGEAKKLLGEYAGAPHLIALVREMDDCCQTALKQLAVANAEDFLLKQGIYKGWCEATKFVKELMRSAIQERQAGEIFMGQPPGASA